MTIRRALLVAALAASSLSLAACGISREEALAVDNANCQSMGLKFGTPEFAQCRLMQTSGAMLPVLLPRANAVGALQNFNNTVQNNRVEYPPPPPMQPIGRPSVDV